MRTGNDQPDLLRHARRSRPHSLRRGNTNPTPGAPSASNGPHLRRPDARRVALHRSGGGVMYADFSLQRVRIMRAYAFLDMESTPIMIEFETAGGASHCTICLHLEDAA